MLATEFKENRVPRESENLELENQNDSRENPDNNEGDNQASHGKDQEGSTVDDYSEKRLPNTSSVTIRDGRIYESGKGACGSMQSYL